MARGVSFYLNGKPVTIEDPAADLLLIDYLRSPEVGLAGPKKACGQGGCGACTVILSSWDGTAPVHRAINSCLRPVCSLGGLAVTTVEGTGQAERPAPGFLSHGSTYGRTAAPIGEPTLPRVAAARRNAEVLRRSAQSAIRGQSAGAGSCGEMNPVAHRLALNNGTQCGYCTVGFVMNMTEFIANQPDATKQQIEAIFDGNLCRCTGYRPILTGMKTFASDWTAQDEAQRMKCLPDDGCQVQCVASSVQIPFPEGAQAGPQPAEADGRQRWVTPRTLDQLVGIMRAHPPDQIRLVHANTAFGVYPDEFRSSRVLVDLRLIDELSGGRVEADRVMVGAAVTYSELIDLLAGAMTPGQDFEPTPIGAAHFMARRTAGRILRNAATVGGNAMLVLRHMHEGEPFPSDLMTALVAIDATVEFLRASTGAIESGLFTGLMGEILADPRVADDVVLLRFQLPLGSGEAVVLPQKVASREVNAHSIVNATTRLEIDAQLLVRDVALVFGGIAPYPWRATATEAQLRGRHLTLVEVPALLQTLTQEVRAELERWSGRMAPLPSEGITDAYREELTATFLYKAIVNALMQRDPAAVPAEVRSSGEVTWGQWPVSDGVQSYTNQAYKAPVSQPYIKLMALEQATGGVHYTPELPVPSRTVHAAFVSSRRALATFGYIRPGTDHRIDTDELRAILARRFPTFVALITHAEIPPQGINAQGMGGDQPLLATDRVSYVGQAISLVVARNEQDAEMIAAFVTAECVGYGPIDWPAPWNEPILSLDAAIRLGSVYPDCPASVPFMSHIWRITRPGSQLGWARDKDPLDRGIEVREAVVDGAPCLVVGGTQTTGGQAHFYMEPQSCLALPADGDRLIVHPATQSPMEMHQTVCMAIGVQYNQVEISVPQVGGGFGGKTEQARFVVGPTALAAAHLNQPVRLVMPRDVDTAMIGKRHPYYGQSQIAIGRDGTIHGISTRMWGDGGAFYDCSFIVSNCIQLRADGAYQVRNFQNQIDVCRTNKAPNTAFRAFGDVQSRLILENAIDDAAFAVGLTAEQVRERNLYRRGDVTPFGQALSYCYMREVWDYARETSGYEVKRREVEEFNARNRWRKRGISMIPVKYGSGYNLVQLEQATAVIVVYAGDGSVIVHQGGVEMGQGNATKCEQIASYILNVPMELIHTQGPRTSITPNPISTGGSTGTAYNGEAVKQACQVLRSRLMEFGYQMLNDHGNEWCHAQGIDFWNYGEQGWAAETEDSNGPAKLVWQNLIQLAYANRVSLVAHFTARIRGGTTPIPAMTYKPKELQPHLPGIELADVPTIGGAVDSFVGFTYSVACSVAEVDILTGEVKVISSDLCYDMGWSLNPAIDVGQVEGAFVQGIGYVLTENLVFQTDGEEKGRLNTTNTWRYKPPAITTIPLELNVRLFPRELAAGVPEDANELLSSKEVGEPPLVLATTVFFAVKAAIRASRLQRNLPGLFRFDAPATVQEVRRACDVDLA